MNSFDSELTAEPTSHFIIAPDGLWLYAAEYGTATSSALPVVCLPGLARTTGDFDVLARALASDSAFPRRVIATDYRGRGRSQYDPDPTRYSLSVELADLEAVLDELDIGPAVFIGTSRGGILTMLMAALAPERIAGAVLNDIGPVIEAQGLMRIKGYVGKLPQPHDFADGAAMLRGLFGPQFPDLTEDEWLEAAFLMWHEHEGTLILNYDANLARTLDTVAPDQVAPDLWPQFESLAHVPAMLIHGGLSDLLSSATVEEMLRRRPDLEVVTVAREGHPPRLVTSDMIGRIAAFARRCDLAASGL